MKIIAKILLSLIVCFAASAASAATFVVNTTDDTLDTALGNGACADSNSNCSLRAAISEANALAGADIITLGAATYTQTLIAPGDDANTGGDWDITSPITINGVSQASTILQAGVTPTSAQNERVLYVGPNGNLTLTNMTVRHGRLTENFVSGGGILSFGALSLTDVTVRDNQVIASAGSSLGGGISNGGHALSLTNTTVTANTAVGASPGAGFGGGVGSSPAGGAVITITNSSISGNTLDSIGTPASGGGLYMGGLYALTVTGSHFDNNTVTGAQGSAGGGARLITNVTGTSSFNFTNCTFNNNIAGSTAAAAVGGGLHLYTSLPGLVGTLDRVSIDGNRTQGTVDSRGGGLYVNPVGGFINVSVTNSSISRNTNDGSRGGGVELSDRFSTTAASSTVNFTNTTISGNTAGTGNGGIDGKGGGAHIEMTTGPMSVNFNFVTITDNFAITSGGGISHIAGNSTVRLKNTIVAGNGAGAAGQDIAGNLASQNYNHIGNLSGGTFVPSANDTSGFDALLGLLQNNGGPTLTHLPDPASPVRNTIPNGVNDCGALITLDQRAFVRPVESACDKGAVEHTPFAPGPWSVSGTITTSDGLPIRNAEVIVTGNGLQQPVKFYTGNFGQYVFTNLPGGAYEVSVSAKRFRFTPPNVIVGLNGSLANVNFSASPQFGGKAAGNGDSPPKLIPGILNVKKW